MFGKAVVGRLSVSAVCVAMLVTISQLAPQREASAAGMLVIKQLDVGHGDAALIEGPCGELGLIDSGKRHRAGAIKNVIGTRALKWISVSHYDSDHIGAIIEIAREVGVGAVYDRGGDYQAKDSNKYRNYFEWVTSKPERRHPVWINRTFSLCSGVQEVTFTVVSVGTDGTAAGGVRVESENDKGVCLKIVFGRFHAATCGDVNGFNVDKDHRDVESAVAPKLGRVEYAKVNHHGSGYSSNEDYVSTLEAQAAVVSTDGSYGHPDPGVVKRWAKEGDVYRTDVHGNVTITTDGQNGFTIETSNGKRCQYMLHESPNPTPTPTPCSDGLRTWAFRGLLPRNPGLGSGPHPDVTAARSYERVACRSMCTLVSNPVTRTSRTTSLATRRGEASWTFSLVADDPRNARRSMHPRRRYEQRRLLPSGSERVAGP